jgi:hypothetical protein
VVQKVSFSEVSSSSLYSNGSGLVPWPVNATAIARPSIGFVYLRVRPAFGKSQVTSFNQFIINIGFSNQFPFALEFVPSLISLQIEFLLQAVLTI